MKKRILLCGILILYVLTSGIFALLAPHGTTFPVTLPTKDSRQSQIPALHDTIKSPVGKDYPAQKLNQAVNILFLGIDRTEERDKYLGIYRSDTIAVARIDPENKTIKILSIPRDTYAYIPIINKMDKINHAYAFGAENGKEIESAVEAVNHFLKGPVVEYYFVIDMEPIPEIIDSLGGVEIDVEIDMKTHEANISKGKQILDGKKAFDYIHWRYSGSGDIDRIKRQQKLIGALYNKLNDSKSFSDCALLVLKYRNNIKTNIPATQIIRLAQLCLEIPPENIIYYMVPGNFLTLNKISYWEPEKKQTEQIVKEFLNK